MENISNQIEESIQKASIPILSNPQVAEPSTGTSNTGYKLLGIHWSIWLIIFIVFCILFVVGLSLFVSKMKDIRSQYSGFFDMLNMLGNIGAQQSANKNATSNSNKGIEMTGYSNDSSQLGTPVNNTNHVNQNILGNLLAKPTPSTISNSKKSYIEDSNSSSIQQKGGKGFCYIGEDKGARVCASVEESDTCMSGNIFPTKDMCINPKLR